MLAPTTLYPLLQGWLKGMGLPHQTVRAGLAALLTALLIGQSLRPSALMRALPRSMPVPARTRYQQVARAWDRPWLSPQLTPYLVAATLALVQVDHRHAGTRRPVVVALDSVRAVPWEVFTLGVVWRGRVVPVASAVLPYPWPKGQFTRTVCALIEQVAAVWPADVPVHFVADRAFPSKALFQVLRRVGWGWTVRLQARHWVVVGAAAQQARTLLGDACRGGWSAQPATFGSGAGAVPGTLVIGRGLVVLPAHQRTVGSLRHRAQQQAKRRQHLQSKHPGRPADGSLATDGWVILFTSAPTWQAATTAYRRRWATEGTYRDGQGGWDGHHGWHLDAVLADWRQPTDRRRVEGLVALWALGTLVQTWIGSQVNEDAPAAVQCVAKQWTTTGRLSVWARGRFALTEPSGVLASWLAETLEAGATQIAAARPAGPSRTVVAAHRTVTTEAA